jgi:hypothetical protein
VHIRKEQIACKTRLGQVNHLYTSVGSNLGDFELGDFELGHSELGGSDWVLFWVILCWVILKG